MSELLAGPQLSEASRRELGYFLDRARHDLARMEELVEQGPSNEIPDVPDSAGFLHNLRVERAERLRKEIAEVTADLDGVLRTKGPLRNGGRDE